MLGHDKFAELNKLQNSLGKLGVVSVRVRGGVAKVTLSAAEHSSTKMYVFLEQSGGRWLVGTNAR